MNDSFGRMKKETIKTESVHETFINHNDFWVTTDISFVFHLVCGSFNINEIR